MARRKEHTHGSPLGEVKAQEIRAIQDCGHHRNSQLPAGITKELDENPQRIPRIATNHVQGEHHSRSQLHETSTRPYRRTGRIRGRKDNQVAPLWTLEDPTILNQVEGVPGIRQLMGTSGRSQER